MASMMKIVLPVAAIAGAAFTGGSSLGLFGASDAAALADAGVAAGASTEAAASAADATASFGTGSWFGNTISSIGSAFQSVSPYLKTAAVIGQIGGTVMGAEGADAQAKAAKDQAASEAAQLQQNAGNAMAASEIREEEQNRETAYVLSDAQAAAAGGGGSATDPTVTTNMKTIAGEGRFRALTDMYQGQAQAQSLQNQANADIYGGKLAAQADTTKMYSTILGGASSLYDKYATVDDQKKNNSIYPPYVPQGL